MSNTPPTKRLECRDLFGLSLVVFIVAMFLGTAGVMAVVSHRHTTPVISCEEGWHHTIAGPCADYPLALEDNYLQPNGYQVACYDNGNGDCMILRGDGALLTTSGQSDLFRKWSGNPNHLQDGVTNGCIKWILSTDAFWSKGCANMPAEAYTYVNVGGAEEIKAQGDSLKCLTGAGNSVLVEAGVCSGTGTRWVFKDG